MCVRTPSRTAKVRLVFEGGLKSLSEYRKRGLQQLHFSKFPVVIYPLIPLDAHAFGARTHPCKQNPAYGTEFNWLTKMNVLECEVNTHR